MHLSPQFKALAEERKHDLNLFQVLVLHLSNGKQGYHMGKIATTTPHDWTVPDETLTVYDKDKCYHCELPIPLDIALGLSSWHSSSHSSLHSSWPSY